MKYKVGDKVRVRKDISVKGNWGFVEGMEPFIGIVVTISKLVSPFDDNDKCMILEDGGEYVWTEEMFEGLVNDAPSITKRINNKHNILNGLTQTDDALTEKLESQNDLVNHPSHYTDGKIEVINFIEDKKLGYHLGNACKYISRCRLKNDGRDKVQDLRKAIWYIERQIYLWEGEER